MIYRIKDIQLKVICEIKEFQDIVYGRFSQFENIENNNTENYLKFLETSVDINIKGIQRKILGKVIKTDIYVIINNCISFIINDEKNIYMHSVIISKNNNGILILGNFGQGKSTLADAFVSKGYEINSTDQSWLRLNKKNELYLNIGSRFYIKNQKVNFIDLKNVQKKIKIKNICRLVGLCDNGNVVINEVEKDYAKVKQISDFVMWSTISPIFTGNVELYNVNNGVKSFLSCLKNIPMNNIRGDKKEIVKKYIDYV